MLWARKLKVLWIVFRSSLIEAFIDGGVSDSHLPIDLTFIEWLKCFLIVHLYIPGIIKFKLGSSCQMMEPESHLSVGQARQQDLGEA